VIYASARHQGVDEALCEELKKYESSAAFTAAEKAAIRLADKMASDHTKVGDDVFGALREHYTEQQILELAWRAAMFIGYGRLIVTLGIESVGQSCAIPAHHGNKATG
jgi:alkylhydroperoxidase family enzyme